MSVNKIFVQTPCGSPEAQQYTSCKGSKGISWANFAFILVPLAVWWQNWRKVSPKDNSKINLPSSSVQYEELQKGKALILCLVFHCVEFPEHFLDRLPLQRERRLKNFSYHKISKIKQAIMLQIQPLNGSKLGKAIAFPVLLCTFSYSVMWAICTLIFFAVVV